MSDETLLSASRRAARFLRIDMAKGGLIKRETLIAFDTLDVQISNETAREKARDAEQAAQAAARAEP